MNDEATFVVDLLFRVGIATMSVVLVWYRRLRAA